MGEGLWLSMIPKEKREVWQGRHYEKNEGKEVVASEWNVGI